MPAWGALLPVVVTPSNQGWTYLRSGDAGDKRLFPLGGVVNEGDDVACEVLRIAGNQSGESFRNLEPRFIDSYRFPVSRPTLSNINLTKVIPFRSEMGDVSTFVAKAYSGLRMGQDRQDRFLRTDQVFRAENLKNVFRVDVDDLKDLQFSPDQSDTVVRIYGENLNDMREEGVRPLSPLANSILRNLDVLRALSNSVDELRRVNICAPQQ